ncbi:MAG: helix-turn-helix domain-containing protein [Actinocatenispora sp.]
MSANVGDRLRQVRKRRGLTQRELARRSGVSLSLVRKLEQGERADTRLETVRRFAVTLGVPTTQLMAGPPPDGDDDAAAAGRWEPVRQALLGTADESTDLDEPPTVAGVRHAVGHVVPLFSGDRFAELRTVLPPLLRDVDALAHDAPEGRALRERVLQLTGWLLTQTRQFDTAESALRDALDNATGPLQAAATVNTLCWLLLRRGRLTDADELAARWADDTEPRLSRATPAELCTWGWLLLRLSAGAVRDNRSEDADDALRLAQAAAVALGREVTPGDDFLRRFGPVTVALKRTENAMVTDRPREVLRLSAAISPGRLRPTSNNRNRHLLDVADAHVRVRQYAKAVEILSGLRSDAPQWLPHQRYARDILTRVLTGRRTLTAEMRTLADAIGVPL